MKKTDWIKGKRKKSKFEIMREAKLENDKKKNGAIKEYFEKRAIWRKFNGSK